MTLATKMDVPEHTYKNNSTEIKKIESIFRGSSDFKPILETSH